MFIPFLTYFAALFAIFNLIWSFSVPEIFPSLKMTFPLRRSLYLISFFTSEWSLTVNFSINFSEKGHETSALKIRSTYTPGVWTHSGSMTPFSTISSTSAITNLAAVAISALKFRYVFSNCRFPILSALFAFTNAKSAKMDYSLRYFRPLKIKVGLPAEIISATFSFLALMTSFPYESVLYLMGNPPF